MKSTLALVSALAIALGLSTASAASAAAKFTVRVKVVGTCAVKANGLEFGTYQGSPVSKSGVAQVRCTKGMPYSVSLEGGNAVRTMSLSGNPVATINYQLKLDGADARGNVTGTGSSGARVLTVLGTIPGSQNPVPGEYTDSVTMTVNY